MGHKWVFWNSHNFDITDIAMVAVRLEVSSRPPVNALPLAIVRIFGSDFNFIDENDLALYTRGRLDKVFIRLPLWVFPLL